MSFYSVNATISARAQKMDSARQTLKNYMMIVKDDEVFAFYGGNQIDGFGKISIPLGMAIKLTENEISIVQSLGPREAYENYEASLVEIFSSRLHDAGFDPDDVHEFMRDIESGSVVDVIAEMDIDSFSIDCYISSSGFVFNGQSVELPGEVRILEKFERVEFDQGHCWSLRSQEKIITVDPNLDEAASFEFDRIDDLLWSSLDEAGRPRGRVVYPSVGWLVEKYHYRMIVHHGPESLEVNFEFRALENKRLRSKKHVGIFATVEVDKLQLWSGDDPIALKKVLNDWCAERPM